MAASQRQRGFRHVVVAARSWSRSAAHYRRAERAAGNPDASLSAFAARATRAAAQRGGTHRDSRSGSGEKPPQQLRGKSTHAGRHRLVDRGHSVRQMRACRAADAGNCRVDSLSSPAFMHPARSAGQHHNAGIKETQTRLYARASMLKARGSFARVPGPSLIRRRAEHSAAAMAPGLDIIA